MKSPFSMKIRLWRHTKTASYGSGTQKQVKKHKTKQNNNSNNNKNTAKNLSTGWPSSSSLLSSSSSSSSLLSSSWTSSLFSFKVSGNGGYEYLKLNINSKECKVFFKNIIKHLNHFQFPFFFLTIFQTILHSKVHKSSAHLSGYN